MSKSYTPRDAACVQAATHIIGDKWSPILLNILATQGPQRFSTLHIAAHGISPRTLSSRLAKLEAEGVVEKKIYTAIPPHTQYTLTTKGADLIPILALMAEWGRKHPAEE